VYLARVIGRVVATQAYEGLEGVALQWIQPLDEDGAPMGDTLVACAVVSTGPGDLVEFVDGREAALACPKTFVPVDAAIIGYVEEVYANGKFIGREPVAAQRSPLGGAATRNAQGAR
jgi:ethanolamine utilization protein EutN